MKTIKAKINYKILLNLEKIPEKTLNSHLINYSYDDIIYCTNFDYEKDLGYENDATIIIVHKEKKLYIVEMD